MNSTDIKINFVNKIFYEIYCLLFSVFFIFIFSVFPFHNSVPVIESKTIHTNQSGSNKSESLTELKITFVI